MNNSLFENILASQYQKESWAVCLVSCLTLCGCSFKSESAPFVEYKYSVKLTVDNESYSGSQTYRCHYDFINPMRGKQWRIRNGSGSEVQLKLSNGDLVLLQKRGHPCEAILGKTEVVTATYIKTAAEPDLIATSSLTKFNLGHHNIILQESMIEPVLRGNDNVLDEEGRRRAGIAQRERHIYFVAYVQTVPIESITSQQFVDFIKLGRMRSIGNGASFPFTGWSDEDVSYARNFSYEFEKRDPNWDDHLSSDPKVMKFFGEPDGGDWIVRRGSPSKSSYFRKEAKPNIDKKGELVEPYHPPFWISYQGNRVEIYSPYDRQDFFDPERNEAVRYSLQRIALPF